MRVTGFTREFDAKVVCDNFLDDADESGQKAATPEEMVRLGDYLDSADMVFGILLAIKVEDKYVPYCLRSDGEWIWPGHLGELVRSRDIDLDEAFLEHVRSRKFRVEKLSKTALDEVQTFIVDKQMLR